MPIAVVERLPAKKFTDATITRMYALTLKGRTNWAIIMLATKITETCPEKHWLCQAKRIFDWFQKNIKYQRDPYGVELIENPLVVFGQRKAGDCDSVVALASLYNALGYPTRFITIKADPTRPNEWSHVYLGVYVSRSISEDWQGGWVSADWTVKTREFGWEPSGFPKKVWPEPEIE